MPLPLFNRLALFLCRRHNPDLPTHTTFRPFIQSLFTVAVVQWVRAFSPQAESWVFESEPLQIVQS